MAMSESTNTTALQQEIAQIEQSLAQKRVTLEQQGVPVEQMPHPKESLREVLAERLTPNTVAGQTTPTSVSAIQTAPATSSTTPLYLQPEYKDRVQALVNIAFSQTIDEAIKQALATNNAALIDAFHDALVDELYSELVKQGKVQPM